MRKIAAVFTLIALFLVVSTAPGLAASNQTQADKQIQASVYSKLQADQKLTPKEEAWANAHSSSGTNELDEIGGPDAFGYQFKDSQEADGPTYSWVDISTTGTEITGLTDDSYAGPFDIGFSFPFYGTDYTQFYMTSNGVISFDALTTSSSYNYSIPNTGGPENMIAWFWDDLNPTDSDFTDVHVYYEMMNDGTNDYLVVSFINYPDYNWNADTESYLTAQVLMYDDGRIVLQYNTIGTTLDVAGSTIGIENIDATDGLQVLYNGSIADYPFSELAIEFNILSADASVSGTVTDAVTSNPIEGAIVTMGSYTDTTDAAGAYSFAEVFSGTYSVSASAGGYFLYSADGVNIVTGANTYDIAMDPFPAVDVFDGFEAGGDAWVVTSATPDTPVWQFGAPTTGPAAAYEGTNVVATNLDANYPVNADEYLMYGSVFVPSESSMLSYYHYVDIETGWDGYNVQVSTDGGTTWTVINPMIPAGYPDDSISGMDSEPGFTGHGSAWEMVAFDLSAYAGQEVWLRFRFGSDSSVTYPGAYLDNIELRGVSSNPVFMGTVTSLADATPIEGASVEVTVDGTGEVAGTTVTDVDGMYSVAVVPGTYNVNVNAAGFVAQTLGPYTVALGDEMTVDFQLDVPASNYTVTGNVSSADTEGQVVAGVSVSVVGLPGLSAITDASGNYSIDNVPEGTYAFYLTHNPIGSAGYHDMTVGGVVVNADNTVHDFLLPEILAPQNLTTNAMDGSVQLTWDPPANNMTAANLIRGIQYRERTLQRLGNAMDAKAVRVRNEMSQELVLMQRRLDRIQNAGELDELNDLNGYRIMVDGELTDDMPMESPYTVTGLDNGHEYQFQVAADYQYDTDYLVWTDPVGGLGLPSGLYEATVEDYSWIEIRPSEGGSGTALNLTDDGESPLMPMPDGWSYMHYGVGYSQFSVSPNGWISFIDDNGGLGGDIPSPFTPNATIAPWWDDQDPGDSDTEDAWYYFDMDNMQIIVEWNVGNYPGPANNIKLYEAIMDLNTNSVTIQYNTAADGWTADAAFATIGVENADGTQGLAYDATLVTDSYAINFHPLDVNYGTLAGNITETDSDPVVNVPNALVTVTDATGGTYNGSSDENGYYEVRLLDRDAAPFDVLFQASGYQEVALTGVDWTAEDGFYHYEDVTMAPIDPSTPPTIIASSGAHDDGVDLVLAQPGALISFDYLQYDDGVVDNATGWNPGYTTDNWFATKFDAPGSNVTLQASDLRFLIFSDFGMWWPAGDESHQPVVVGVFNDNGSGLPGDLVWTSEPMTPSEDNPYVDVAPNVSVTSTFFVGFYNTTPAEGQEPLSLDTNNDYAALFLTSDGGTTWSPSVYGDPFVRASILYTPSGGGAPTAANLRPSHSEHPQVSKAAASATTTLSMSVPQYGLQGEVVAPARPHFLPFANELDEFLGFNVEYSSNGTDWTQANTELITDNFFFVSLGSENENMDYMFRANAVVTDPNGGADITSNYSDVDTTRFNMPPAPPSDMTVDVEGADATISWTAPTTNADGTDLVDLAGYTVWNLMGAEPVELGSTDDATTTFTFTAESAGIYAFAVTANDEVPNISGPSNVISTIVGAPDFMTGFEPTDWNSFEPMGVWENGAPTAGPAAAHNGEQVWATVLGGDYAGNNQDDTLLMTEPFAVTSDGALVSYWHWVDYETGWDGYNVRISTDMGATWSVITPIGGYPDDSIYAFENGAEPGFTSNSGGWQQVFIPVGEYNGQAIMLGFRHGTDGSVNTYYGVAIDDMDFYGIEPPHYTTISGVIHDCSVDGPTINGVEIYSDGHLLGTSGVDGSFEVEALSGTHTMTFVHEDYWTVVEEDMTMEPEGTMDMGDMVMTRPMATTDPTTLSMLVNIEDTDPVTSTFELTNDGCGPMVDYTLSVELLTAADDPNGPVADKPGRGFLPDDPSAGENGTDDSPMQTWLTVDPAMGDTLHASETQTVTVTVDISADPEFNPVDGQEIFAQVIVSGEHMADAIVTLDFVFTNVGDDLADMPTKYDLHQNYPNPFNPTTEIKFDLVKDQKVKLAVYNMLGQEVARLADGQMQAGYHQVSFDASRLASGVYFYRIETPAFTKMRKMVLVK